MRNKKFLFGLLGSALLSLALSSCIEDITDDPHYAVPSTLKGSAYETLQKEGRYSTFLKGVDLTGYKPIVDGKSILTVMAPDDAAFATYLKEQGYGTIDEMYAANPTEVKKLIGFHLLYYSLNWEKLVNFRPQEGDEATAEERMASAGYYYKFRTKSSDAISREWDPAQKDTVSVYHQERFMPVSKSLLLKTGMKRS